MQFFQDANQLHFQEVMTDNCSKAPQILVKRPSNYVMVTSQ
jgi:hypothetical protein